MVRKTIGMMLFTATKSSGHVPIAGSLISFCMFGNLYVVVIGNLSVRQ